MSREHGMALGALILTIIGILAVALGSNVDTVNSQMPGPTVYDPQTGQYVQLPPGSYPVNSQQAAAYQAQYQPQYQQQYPQTQYPDNYYPGMPSTGAGGDAFRTLAILCVSGLVALGGLAYLVVRRTAIRM